MTSKSPSKSAYYWKDAVAYFKLPSAAFRGGTDVDGSPIYVGRAKQGGDLLLGSVVPSKGMARVAYAGGEHVKIKFQVLCCNEQCLEWIPSHDGEVPPRAVPAGKTDTGETLYVGRVHHKASQTVGKICPGHQICYIPFDGKEVMYKQYEILVVKSHA